VVPSETIDPVSLPAIQVSNVVRGNQDLSFDVSETGVPVLVKMSYFPNWQVDGAKGPYRVAPNFMVVVPTSTHVRLHFEPSTSDRVAYLLTFVGIGLLFFWRRRGDMHFDTPHPYMLAPQPIHPGDVHDDGWDAPPPGPAGQPPGTHDITEIGGDTDPDWGELDWSDPEWRPRAGTGDMSDGSDDLPGSV
jgi:hypothetical protein